MEADSLYVHSQNIRLLSPLSSPSPHRLYYASFLHGSTPLFVRIIPAPSSSVLTRLHLFYTAQFPAGNSHFFSLHHIHCSQSHLTIATEWGEWTVLDNIHLLLRTHMKYEEGWLMKELWECVDALARLHRLGLSHCNVSLSTMFVRTSEVKIADPSWIRYSDGQCKKDARSLGLCFLSMAALQEIRDEDTAETIETWLGILPADLARMLGVLILGDELCDCDRFLREFPSWDTVNPSFPLPLFAAVPGCMYCRKSTSDDEVALPCAPQAHIFCSRRCFFDYLRVSTRDFVIDLTLARCPHCIKSIPIDFTISVLGGQAEAVRVVRKSLFGPPTCEGCHEAVSSVLRCSCGHCFCTKCAYQWICSDNPMCSVCHQRVGNEDIQRLLAAGEGS